MNRERKITILTVVLLTASLITLTLSLASYSKACNRETSTHNATHEITTEIFSRATMCRYYLPATIIAAVTTFIAAALLTGEPL